MADIFDTITLKKPKDVFDTASVEPEDDIFDTIEEQLQVPKDFELDFTIDTADPIFQLSQKAKEIDTGIVRDFLGLTKPETEEPSLQPFDPSEPPGVRRKIKPRDILRATKDEDIDFIRQATINDPFAVSVSVGKLIDREQKIRQEMQSLSQESGRTQNIIFAVGNFTNLFNVNEYLDRQGLNPFSKGQYAITLEAVNRLVAQRPLSVENVLLEFGVQAPKILLEFAVLPDVGSKIKMLEKTPRLRRILLTGLKFATRAAVQAPSVKETLAERSRRVLEAGGFGVAVGAAGEFIPRTAIRAPITISGAGLLTLAQGGSREDIIKTMATIAGFEALGLIKRASRATDARIRRRLENKAIKAIRKQGEARGLDLSKVPEEALRQIAKTQKQIDFWQKQRQKGRITQDVLDKRLGEQVDRVRPILEAIARQQPTVAPARPPAAKIQGVKPKEAIKVPPKPIQAKPEAKKVPEVVPVAEVTQQQQIDAQLETTKGKTELFKNKKGDILITEETDFGLSRVIIDKQANINPLGSGPVDTNIWKPIAKPATEIKGKEIFTSAPQEWKDEKDLVDWGNKGIRTQGNRALSAGVGKKTRKTFVWTEDLTELPTRLPKATLDAFRNRTDEIWKLQRRGKGEDVWLVPKVLKGQLREELGPEAFVQRTKLERSPKQKLNDAMNSMKVRDIDPVIKGEVILDIIQDLGLKETDLTNTQKGFIKDFRDEQARKGIEEVVRPRVEQEVLTEEELERIAIQEEQTAGEIGDFLDGIVEEVPRQKDLIGRPVLRGGAVGEQAEFLEKEKFKLPEPDVEGQQKLFEQDMKKIQVTKNQVQVSGKIKEIGGVDIVPDEDVSIVDDPGTLGAAETIPKIDASLEPKGKPVSAREVIFQMERDFGVPFRSKVTHIFKKKIAHFQIKSKVIRAIDVRDLSAATHELGHHLDHNFFGNIRKHPPPGANQELLDLGKALYGKRKPPGGYKSEGVAEYMRLWLTDNDAENRAPFFTKWFEKYLKDNPDVAKRLRRTRKLIEKWKAQGAVARVESQIVTGKIRGSIKERLQDGVRILETLLLDRFAPLRRLRDEIGAEQFAPSEDPFVVATANATKAGAKAAFFALEGTTDLAGTINGISLQEVLAPVSKDIKNWVTWAVAARARHLHSLGINPGISKTDADFVFQTFKEEPGFQKALDGFTKWNHRGLDYMAEAGAIEKSVVNRIKKRHPVYMPFKRAFKEGEIQLKFVPAKGFVETGSPIKKIKGSGRAIKDPIQEAMLGMEAMISTAQKAQVSLAMAKLADRFPGVGKFIVRIPAPKVPTTFSAEQIKGDILKIAVQRLGIDPTEINIAQLMDTWDEDLTVFTKGFKFTGKENVISIVRNDKRFFYEVSPDLFKTLKGLDKFTLPWYLDFWMGRANRALKLGATGVNPTFALRNMIRDLQTFGFTTEFARGNFLAGVAGIGKDVATDFSGIAEKFGVKIPKSQDVLRFRALGGELATFILQDKTGVKHLKSTVLASDGTKYVINTFLHPIHVLRELVGITEVGTRIGEFGPALREGERRYGKGSVDASMFALNAAQDVTVNFSRMGTLFQILNQIIPFSNVAVQGPAKIFKTIRKRPLRSIRRGMIGLMIPAIWLWWRNKDKKWWKSLPTHEKGNYLHFENPKDPNEIFRFPVAFELGHIFQTIPVMALDAIYQNDPSDIGDMLKFVLDQANPLDWPAAIGPIIDVKENLDFAGRPIVPRSVAGRLPEDRFTPRSTALMKFIGRKLKVSPAQLDFLVNTYSGGVYGRTARLLSLTNEPPETKSDLPIIGTLFLRDPFAPRKEIEEFYNRLELLSQKNQSQKITKKERRELIIRGKIARAISPQWKLLRDSKTVKHRKVIYSRIENAIIKGDKAINR